MPSIYDLTGLHPGDLVQQLDLPLLPGRMPSGNRRKPKQNRWRNLRRRVWERDGGLCQLCAEPVSLEEMSLDRIAPTAWGGRYSEANCQATHLACNVRKDEALIPRFAYATRERLAELAR